METRDSRKLLKTRQTGDREEEEDGRLEENEERGKAQ